MKSDAVAAGQQDEYPVRERAAHHASGRAARLTLHREDRYDPISGVTISIWTAATAASWMN